MRNNVRHIYCYNKIILLSRNRQYLQTIGTHTDSILAPTADPFPAVIINGLGVLVGTYKKTVKTYTFVNKIQLQYILELGRYLLQ